MQELAVDSMHFALFAVQTSPRWRAVLPPSGLLAVDRQGELGQGLAVDQVASCWLRERQLQELAVGLLVPR